MRRFLSFSLSCLAGALGCTPSVGPATGDLAEYCAVATREGLASWSGDVVTLCTAPPAAGDHDEPAPCAIYRAARGALAEVALGVEAQLALPAADGALVVLATDGRLLHGRPGALSEIARWAAEPQVSEDGRRVAYVALADGFTEPELGVPTQIVAHDLIADRREVVSTDELASTPFPVPGSSDVLYVSTRTGTASLWRASPGAAPRQLTNAGMERPEQGFVPVPGRQLAWIGGGEAAFTAQYEDDRVWRLDLASGEAEELGPGAWPRAEADGSIVARRGAGSDCAVTYLDGRTP